MASVLSVPTSRSPPSRPLRQLPSAVRNPAHEMGAVVWCRNGPGRPIPHLAERDDYNCSHIGPPRWSTCLPRGNGTEATPAAARRHLILLLARKNGRRALTDRLVPRTVRWSSGFSLGRLTVMVGDGHSHAVARRLLTRQERRLKPELQLAANGTRSVHATVFPPLRRGETGGRSSPICTTSQCVGPESGKKSKIWKISGRNPARAVRMSRFGIVGMRVGMVEWRERFRNRDFGFDGAGCGMCQWSVARGDGV